MRSWAQLVFALFVLGFFRYEARCEYMVKYDQVGTFQYGSYVTTLFPSSVSENEKISGTRVEVQCQPNSGMNGHVVTGLKTKDYKVELIGGTENFEIFSRVEELEGHGEVVKFRFATTFVPDGSTIQIKISVKFKWDGQSEWVSSVKTWSFVAYNKLQTIGTVVNGAAEDSQLFEDNSTEFVGHVFGALGSSHTKNPSTAAAAIDETETEFFAKVKSSTVLAGMVHGEKVLLRDSYGVNFNEFDPTIKNEVLAKSTTEIPPYNLVILYTCSVLSGSAPFPAVVAYGIGEVNQALCGFGLPVAADLWTKDEWDEAEKKGFDYPQVARTTMLSDHAELVFTALSVGNVIGNALTTANNLLPPLTYIFNVPARINMSIIGDSYSRTKFVYMNSTEWGNYGLPTPPGDRNRWWIPLP